MLRLWTLVIAACAFITPTLAKSDPLVPWTKGYSVWPQYEDWEVDPTNLVSPTEYIKLSIGLPQSNPSALEDTLLRVSDPSSAAYGKFISKTAALAYLAPKPSDLKLVSEWLATKNVSINPPSPGVIVSPAGDWYDLNVTVAQANSLFGTNFTAYFSDFEYTRELRATSYNIPKSLLNAIYTLQPTTIPATGLLSTSTRRRQARRRPTASRRKLNQSPRTRRAVNAEPSLNCTVEYGAVPPNCIRELYNVGNYTPLALKGNMIGVAGYLENVAQFSDLRLYLEMYNPSAAAANYTFDLVSPLEPAAPQGSNKYGNGEANLDEQVVAGLVAPIPSTFYSISGRGTWNPDLNTAQNSNEPYLALISYLLNLDDSELPSVLTTSYGDDEQSVSKAYAQRVCTGFAALGARGVSVIFSTGDEGVGPGSVPGDINFCTTNDGTNRLRFDPNFPASCPWVTSVGETQGIPEIASAGSAGGFSEYFPRPAYQNAVVNKYLSWWGTTWASYFNRNGRAMPDVTSQGAVPLYDEGQWTTTGGTSCAAPTVAGLVGLLNDYRLRNGLTRLGFLNPLLYSDKAKDAFNDITVGNNDGCQTTGFNATTGWDPISGLGSFNFGALLKVIG